jgi:uncharacterized membrane protein
VLLVLLGVGTYVGTGSNSVTALIPAAFGLPLVLSGVVGLKHAWRMHAMHAAATIALLGLFGALARPVGKLLSGTEIEFNTAFYAQMAMAALCILFVVLAVKSFVDARIRRRMAAKNSMP